MGDERRDFVVAVGPAAHERNQLRVGDEVRGEGFRVDDPDLETADIYKVSAVTVGERERATVWTASPPVTGVPPTFERSGEADDRRRRGRSFQRTLPVVHKPDFSVRRPRQGFGDLA